MAGTDRLDERGRLTVDRAYREHLPARVVQIWTPHGLLVRPVPDTLPDKGRLPDALKASGEEAALEEIDEELREGSA